MSLLGKILTILNAVAAIAFLAIAALDYQARNNWSYAVFRHELAIHGLPLDDKDDSWRVGRAIVKDLNKKTLDEVFARASGAPLVPQIHVKTQLEAVQQAKKAAQALIDGAATEAEKRKAVAAIWLPLLAHGDDREAALKHIKNDTIELLTGNVDALYAHVENELAKSSADATSAEYKRMLVADLLYKLLPIADATTEPKLREWCLAVIGLDAYVLAADRDASNLFAQIGRLDAILKEESAAFVKHHQDLLPKLVLLNDQLKQDKARFDDAKKLLEQQNLLYQVRKAERDELLDKIRRTGEAATNETATLLAVQKQLFELQREIAAAREQNEKLETQIRTKELGK